MMKKKNVLSLHEETEKEAAEIEKEILEDSRTGRDRSLCMRWKNGWQSRYRHMKRHKVKRKRKCIGTVHFSEEE